MSASFSPVSVVKLLTILAISRPLFSKHTIIAAVVSAESTDYTMQLSAIKSPRRAVAVHVAFEIGSVGLPNESKYYSPRRFSTHMHTQ